MARSSDLPFPLSLIKDRSFQASEIRRVIGISLLYLGITTALVGFLYSRVLDALVSGAAPMLFVSEDASVAAEAVPGLGDVLGQWLLIMLAVNVIVSIGLGIFITRRLGQPILAIKRSLREIGNGNLDVRLRTTDSRDFGEITAELATAMHAIRVQIAAAKAGIEQAQSGDAPLDASIDPDSEDSDVEAIEQEAGLTACRKALDYFQVDGQLDDDDSKAA